MIEEVNTNMAIQEIPHKWTSHVPKAAPGIKEVPESNVKKEEIKANEKIMAKLKEILRYQKRTYDLQSVWRGFVKADDILATQHMEELKARNQDIEWAAGKEPKTFEGETWKGEKYIRLKWYGPAEDNRRKPDGKRERSGERRRETKAEKANLAEPHRNGKRMKQLGIESICPKK